MSNKKLKLAGKNKNDEFYTSFEDIENELKNYSDYFKNKVVYCNCDDHNWSNFFNYFKSNFKTLNLKKLIASHYSPNTLLNAMNENEYIEIEEDNGILIETKKVLNGDGSFSSSECIELLKQSDIICTNPPFSLFKEFVDLLISSEKEFIILGNMNAVTYKRIFNYIKNNKLWLGINTNKTLEFKVDDSYNRFQRIDENGNKFCKVPSITWFTNLKHDKILEKIELTKKFDNSYKKYDNYDAIEVSKTVDIPKDYFGFMGVPITFLCKYNPEQFEIFGIMNTGEENPGIRLPNTKHGAPSLNGVIKYLRLIVKCKC